METAGSASIGSISGGKKPKTASNLPRISLSAINFLKCL